MKNALLLTASVIASFTVLSACAPSGDATSDAAATSAAVAPAAKLGSFGIDLTAKDESVHPGDAFFQFVNGGWLERTEIPADRSRFGSFNVLADRAELLVSA